MRTNPPKYSPIVLFLGLGTLVVVLLGYSFIFSSGGGNQSRSEEGAIKEEKGSKTGKKNLPVLVSIATVKTEDVPETISAIGNVEALETVAIQSQVAGQLKKVYFKQGDFVKQGQLLFEIDPRLQNQSIAQANASVASGVASVQQSQANAAKSAASIDVAKANLQRDQAQLLLAQTQETRYRALLDKNYVTREQYDQIKSSLGTAQSVVAADQAAIANAQAQLRADQAAVQFARSSSAANVAMLNSNKIQLGFTRITSPVSGKTGQLLINVGNIIQPNSSTLVSITRLTPILVSFSIPEKYLLKIQQAMTHSKLPIQARIQNDVVSTQLPENGVLVFVDNTVDPSSGTVKLKGQFENKDQHLWPGRFVDISLKMGITHDAIVIPALAVQKGQQGDFVYVIESKKAIPRQIVVERITDGQAIILKGLSFGEQVVTDGQMRLAPGSKVKIAQQLP